MARLQGWRVPPELRALEEPVIYVEALFASTVAAEFGVLLDELPDDWLPALPAEYRNRTIELSTLVEARRRSRPAFVKPPNDKSFPARVYAPEDLPAEFPPSMPVLVAEPVEWEVEFRCFALDRRVATSSIYLRNGELQAESEYTSLPEENASALEFASRVLQDPRVHPPRTIALDVGIIRGRGWAVVEANAAWGAGIYGCDPVEALGVLRHAGRRA